MKKILTRHIATLTLATIAVALASLVTPHTAVADDAKPDIEKKMRENGIKEGSWLMKIYNNIKDVDDFQQEAKLVSFFTEATPSLAEKAERITQMKLPDYKEYMESQAEWYKVSVFSEALVDFILETNNRPVKKTKNAYSGVRSSLMKAPTPVQLRKNCEDMRSHFAKLRRQSLES